MITAGATAPRISHVNLPWCENRYRSFGPRFIKMKIGKLKAEIWNLKTASPARTNG